MVVAPGKFTPYKPHAPETIAKMRKAARERAGQNQRRTSRQIVIDRI
jgi:hypothetical protein